MKKLHLFLTREVPRFYAIISALSPPAIDTFDDGEDVSSAGLDVCISEAVQSLTSEKIVVDTDKSNTVTYSVISFS